MINIDTYPCEFVDPPEECLSADVSCLTCKYWKEKSYSPTFAAVSFGVRWFEYQMGECKRFPPFLKPQNEDDPESDFYEPNSHPRTEAENWCGEYKRDPDAKLGKALDSPTDQLKNALDIKDEPYKSPFEKIVNK